MSGTGTKGISTRTTIFISVLYVCVYAFGSIGFGWLYHKAVACRAGMRTDSAQRLAAHYQAAVAAAQDDQTGFDIRQIRSLGPMVKSFADSYESRIELLNGIKVGPVILGLLGIFFSVYSGGRVRKTLGDVAFGIRLRLCRWCSVGIGILGLGLLVMMLPFWQKDAQCRSLLHSLQPTINDSTGTEQPLVDQQQNDEVMNSVLKYLREGDRQDAEVQRLIERILLATAWVGAVMACAALVWGILWTGNKRLLSFMGISS